jgi:bacteriocin biosynthesis cyclodehydratase domain-containing protein
VTYVADPAWALVHDPGLLVLHAGADELFAIEDVSDAVAAELLALWSEPVMDPGSLSRAAGDVFEQLKAAGIVRNVVAARREYALGVRWAGSRDRALAEALAAALPARIALAGAGEEADLVLFVRTDGTLAQLTEDGYAQLATPHLLLDLAFGHTICLGPLVFAGQTACLACLAGRISHRWGDLQPPPRPRMTEHPALAAGLAALAVGEILLRDGRSLVNRTVAHDFATHGVRCDSVYRLPMCPACSTGAAPRSGSIELPWAAAAAP